MIVRCATLVLPLARLLPPMKQRPAVTEGGRVRLAAPRGYGKTTLAEAALARARVASTLVNYRDEDVDSPLF